MEQQCSVKSCKRGARLPFKPRPAVFLVEQAWPRRGRVTRPSQAPNSHDRALEEVYIAALLCPVRGFQGSANFRGWKEQGRRLARVR